MAIYGSNLASVASQTRSGGDFKGNLAPSALGGTTVTIGGQPAFIDYLSPGQVNAQVPSNVAPGSQPVVDHDDSGRKQPAPTDYGERDRAGPALAGRVQSEHGAECGGGISDYGSECADVRSPAQRYRGG